MKIQLNTVLKTLEDKPMSYSGKIATVKHVALEALLNSNSQNYERKVALAKKIAQTEKELSLKAEDVTLIKKSVLEIPATALLVNQFIEALDPVEEEEEDAE